MNSNYIAATQAKNQSHIPVWFMRQAGRYLPEYMELKEQYDFRTRTHTPSLMKEITLQPFQRYPLDAAIMFSDILTCLEFMGAAFDFNQGGPKLAKAGPDVFKKLSALTPSDLSFVAEGIGMIRKELDSNIPLIGFVGAPFTLASYIVEGGTSREFLHTRKFMKEEPEAFQKGIQVLAESVANYLKYQVESGVNAVQIFDSWVGVLSKADYDRFLFPYMKELIEEVKSTKVPVTLYSQPATHILTSMLETGADVLSLDWRVDLADFVARSPETTSFQGNLDPIVTTLERSKAEPYVDSLLEAVEKNGLRNRYIFNVGHGVSPLTRPETIGKIIERVHSF